MTNDKPDAMVTATVSLDDGWVRVYPTARLSREAFNGLRYVLGLAWKRAEACLAGPWSPRVEDTLRQQHGVALEEENVDLREVAASRAAHYAAWADNAAERAEVAQAAERDILARIPMGQPILVGHHSEGRHRRDLARADTLIRRACEESDRAEKWGNRAEATVRHAERLYTAEQLTARIGLLETTRRRHERAEIQCLDTLDLSPLNRSAANELDAHRRYVAFIDRRIAYARQLLAEAETAAAGDVARSVEARRALAIEVGGAVSTNAPGDETVYWYQVVRVNTKTVTVFGWLHVPQLTHKIKRDDIKQTMTAADWAAAYKEKYGPATRVIGG